MSTKTAEKEFEPGQPISVLEWDWDDSELIAAFNKATTDFEKERKRKQKQDSQAFDENETSSDIKSWKEHDFCQAIYSGDNLPYEAQILEIYSDEETCSVIFLGYENQEQVKLSDLSKSKGKAARKKQIKNVFKNNEDNSSLMSDMTGTSTDMDVSTDSGQSSCPTGSNKDNKSENDSGLDQQTFSVRRSRSRGCNSNRSHCHGHCHHRNMFPFAPNFPLCPTMMNSHFLGPNFMPPIPMRINGEINDPDMIPSMLHSWFMAGYHTGLLASRMRPSNHHH